MPTTKTIKTAKPKSTRSKSALAFPPAATEAGNDTSALNRPTLALPEPEVLVKYEKIIPGGAERILELAEQQASHAHELESRQLETSAKLKLVCQIITFLLALGAGALGAALLLAGSELAGLLVIVIDAAALAAVSLHSKRN